MNCYDSHKFKLFIRNLKFRFFRRGSQGLMFGYATDETEECMPLTVVLAHRLNQKIAELRRSGVLSWARPDSKTQVSYRVIIPKGSHFHMMFKNIRIFADQL